jgi:hypothetical protein
MTTSHTPADVQAMTEQCAGWREVATKLLGSPDFFIDPSDLLTILDDRDALLAEVTALREKVAGLKATLRELVECKDLHDEAELASVGIHSSSGDEWAYVDRLTDEYRRRKPRAWAAARAALTNSNT